MGGAIRGAAGGVPATVSDVTMVGGPAVAYQGIGDQVRAQALRREQAAGADPEAEKEKIAGYAAAAERIESDQIARERAARQAGLGAAPYKVQINNQGTSGTPTPPSTPALAYYEGRRYNPRAGQWEQFDNPSTIKGERRRRLGR